MDLQELYDRHQVFMNELLTKAEGRKIKAGRNLEKEDAYLRAFQNRDFAVSMHTNTFQNPPHRHEFFELVYVHRGSCTNFVDSAEICMKQGDICLLNTNAEHTLKLDNIERDTIFNLLIRRSMMDRFDFKVFSSEDFVANFFLKSIQKQREEKNYLLFPQSEETAEQISLFQKIIQEFYDDKCYKETKISHLFDCLMIELVRSYKVEIDVRYPGSGENQKFSDLVKYIGENSDSVTLESLARQFNYHPQSLSRIIKQQTGSSFQKFFTDIRLEQAARLLCESSEPVAEIIRKVGYSNRTWFNKMFQQKFGVSPGEYRKKSPDFYSSLTGGPSVNPVSADN